MSPIRPGGPGGVGKIIPPQLTLGQNWQQFDQFGISQPLDTEFVAWDTADMPWHGGRLTDVLVLKNGTIYVTSDGGIWSLRRDDAGHWAATAEGDDVFSPTGFNGIVEDPTVPGRIFAAGGINGPTLVALDPTWRQIPLPGLPTRSLVRQMDISNGCLFLATNVGLYWCPLPPAHSGPDAYHFEHVVLGPGGADDLHCVSATMTGIVFTDMAGNIYKGAAVPSKQPRPRFSPPKFDFSYSTVYSGTPGRTIYVGKDYGDSGIAYAVTTGDKNLPGQILKSMDDGGTWTALNTPAFAGRGLQREGRIGAYGDLIVIGWATAYIYDQVTQKLTDALTQDRQNTPQQSTKGFELLGPRTHVHADINSVRFFGFQGTEAALFLCSDGGLASSSDKGSTWTSAYNRRLLNLQIQPRAKYVGGGGFSGSMSASQAHSGLIVAGTQDNGVLALAIPLQSDVESSSGGYWVQVSGDDGQFVAMTGAEQVLWNNQLSPTVFLTPELELPGWVSGESTPLTTQLPAGTSGKLTLIITEVATSPGTWFADLEDTMWAVVTARAGTQTNVVFGMFAGPTGGNPRLIPIAVLPVSNGQRLTAVYAPTSNTVLLGTSDGQILRIDGGGSVSSPVTSGQSEKVVAESTAPVKTVSVCQFAVCPLNGDLFAAYWGSGPGGALASMVVRKRAGGSEWVVIDEGLFIGTQVTSICADQSGFVYVATRETVFAYNAFTDEWFLASTGLPKSANCSNVLFVRDPESGLGRLYLGTYGRSVWWAMPAKA